MMTVTRNINSISVYSNEAPEFSNGDSIILAADLDYKVENRTLIPITVQTDVAVEGDNNSQIIGITIDRYFDNIDLSEKTIQIAFENANGKTDAYTVNNYSTFNDKINLYWLIDSRLTEAQGLIRFQVRFITIDETGKYSYLWQTKIQTFGILPRIVILNDASPIDYTKEEEFIEANKENVYFNIVDEEVPINIEERTIGELPKEIVVKGDSHSQVLTFKLPLMIEGVSVTSKIITIKYVNAYGEGDRAVAINITRDDSYVYFGWLIDGKATAATGKLQFAIELLGYLDNIKDKFYVWQTKPATINVLNGLTVEEYMEDPGVTWLQQWELTANEFIKRSEDAAEKATIEAARSVSYGNKSETSAANALVSEQNAKASEENVSLMEDNVVQLKQDVINYTNEAKSYRDETLQARDAAIVARDKAEEAQTGAETAESNAKNSENAAQTAQTAAETAQLGAEANELKAESAQIEAEEAMVSAQNYQISASQAKNDALTAQTKAEIAQRGAETALASSEEILEEIQDIKKSIMTVEVF